MIGIIVDAEVQIEARRWDLVPPIGPKMRDLSEPRERPVNVDAGRVSPASVVDYQGNAVNSHRSAPC
jgi:hypothetical protein